MDLIKQALQKTDLSEEQLKLSGAKVKSAVLQKISMRNQPLASFYYSPLLGFASCAAGLLLGIMLQSQSQMSPALEQQAYNQQYSQEMEILNDNDDYTIVAFLNIMEDSL